MEFGEPEVSFRRWTRWDARREIRLDPACGGVYLFGYFDAQVPHDGPSAESLPKRVIYVGEAKGS